MSELSIMIDTITKQRDLYLKRGLELASFPHQSSETALVFEAFAAAQGEFPSIIKLKQGYGYKYAELSHVLAMVTPVLSKNGLHFTQYMSRDNILHSRIGHSSGQYFESQYKIPALSEEEFSSSSRKTSYMQELGSRRTYIRRYEALALLGIHPEGEDTDGARPQ